MAHSPPGSSWHEAQVFCLALASGRNIPSSRKTHGMKQKIYTRVTVTLASLANRGTVILSFYLSGTAQIQYV